MKLLKGCLAAVPIFAVFISIGWNKESSILFAYPAITWFGLGLISFLTFESILFVDGKASIGDLLPGVALVSLGFFSALMVGVLGLVSLGDPEKRVAYITDQVSREARSGIFD